MKKMLYLFLIMSIIGTVLPEKDKCQVPEKHVSKEDYNAYHFFLCPGLKRLIRDYKTWSADEKNKLHFSQDGVCSVDDLSKERQKDFQGNVKQWIEERTHTQAQRVCLAVCLEYLQ